MLFARNAQEAGDLCLISRRVAEESYTPFFNVQDGFLTTHTVEDIRRPESELIKSFLRPPAEALVNLIDPSHPVMSGVVQNQDAYMRGKIAGRAFYAPIKANLKKVFAEFTNLTGRHYDFIDTFQMEDAEYAIVGMGSYMETARAAVRALREKKGIKVGVVNITSYRPFPGPELVEALKNVKAISVLERMDDSNAPENPLAREIKAAFADALWGHPDFTKISHMPVIQHGAGGLGSYDVRVHDMQAIVENLAKGKSGKLRYCLGIDHPDTLQCSDLEIDTRSTGSFAMRGYSIGGFGSIATNRVIASVCSELFNMSVQAYPKYGAEKKGMPTMYFMAAGPSHIETHQELKDVDFVAINDVNVFLRGNPLNGLSQSGGIFLQTQHALAEDIWAELPEKYKEIIRTNGYRLYGLDAMSIARTVARSAELINRMQGIVLLGVFLRVTPLARIRGLNEDDLLGGMEKILTKTFGKRGSKAIEDNMTCIRRGFHEVVSIAPMYQESMQDAWR
jgi:pyruvate-ferredoxin/flavodoxin oxidoreductase